MYWSSSMYSLINQKNKKIQQNLQALQLRKNIYIYLFSFLNCCHTRWKSDTTARYVCTFICFYWICKQLLNRWSLLFFLHPCHYRQFCLAFLSWCTSFPCFWSGITQNLALLEDQNFCWFYRKLYFLWNN